MPRLLNDAPFLPPRSTRSKNKNKKHKKKIKDYHRFFGIVEVGNKLYTVKVVVEKTNKNKTPLKLSLYGIYIEKEIKKSIARGSSRPSELESESRTEQNVPKGASLPHGFEPSIQDMLTGVKDDKGNLYISEDGTPNFEFFKGALKDTRTMYQMAGERAKTAALDKLEQAKSMEQAGKLPDDIYKETGWLKGKDGKWRFEIPDNLDAIKADEFISEGAAAKWPLGRLYENDALC